VKEELQSSMGAFGFEILQVGALIGFDSGLGCGLVSPTRGLAGAFHAQTPPPQHPNNLPHTPRSWSPTSTPPPRSRTP
jgi:hypothetical protein